MSEQEISVNAQHALHAILDGQLTAQETATLAMQYIKNQEEEIQELHQHGAGGLEIAEARSNLLDYVLDILFRAAIRRQEGKTPTVSLVAQGGYGRRQLNPSSDLDLLFLLPKASHKLPKPISTLIEEVLYTLWDCGFKVGHACRSIGECISEAKADQQSKTAQMDARLISGDDKLFDDFTRKFEKECVQKGQEDFFNLRREDLRRRHSKYSHTVFLQEPHVKESCGGLRDYQNVLWVARVKRGFKSLEELVEAKIITNSTCQQLQAGFDFLHRVRNELHYENGRCTDTLTLRLQGVVANRFAYPQKTILRRCEFFMRDYYRHTRAIYTHSTSLMEYFEIERQERKPQGLLSILPFRTKQAKAEKFDGFIARNGRISLAYKEALEEDPNRLMRLFQHCQLKSLELSPQARRYIHRAAKKIDRSFRYKQANRETFRAILERKGEVGRILRLMHRTTVLDKYLPEFGALDCLVQHEFFHRYTADEHTLRCIDQLDSLVDSPDETDRGRKLYRRLLHNIQDPYALYLALILHDTGRAENVREHIDGSTILADKVCRRLRISGGRRSLIMFLVDHHLTFWRYATSRDLSDITVIEEFANIMKDKANLDALLLFTWADSNGTNEEAWSPWKESLMLQLYEATRLWLRKGKEHFKNTLTDNKDELRTRCRKILSKSYHEEMERHFELMPNAYFRFREPRNISIHIKSVYQFFKRNAKSNGAFECDMRWIDRSDRSHTELVVTAWNRPLFLEKVCCALASQEINIIGADVYTRLDGVVCDIFQVCTVDHEPVTLERDQKRVLETFRAINQDPDPQTHYDPNQYLKRKTNFLRTDVSEGGIPFPTRVHISNDLSDTCTAIEIQALDRIALLHDLFYAVDQLGLATVHARICTEKGAAMNTIYVTWPDGSKIINEEKHEEITEKLGKLIS
ncbi:[protein-PII] uridylyltransferase [Verrucomicrobiaceae bacterium N1E253]|uniref:Bifunctional uridylyltransferase/uridylyl-removing enzyme n=1 Tax=Oceaniferula marina TaxID=2748318 RepID=A0A851GPG2_9BACT|nr:[protein-PII] uridylyltransferase [Oceaniferula marina]NWK56034.1 [protein-PII] uridylyltransferase [Oceaniferula marina]